MASIPLFCLFNYSLVIILIEKCLNFFHTLCGNGNHNVTISELLFNFPFRNMDVETEKLHYNKFGVLGGYQECCRSIY